MCKSFELKSKPCNINIETYYVSRTIVGICNELPLTAYLKFKIQFQTVYEKFTAI